MPRIDPMKLLVCLSVLLAPNGGIRTAAEVKRLANLMAKFSKKLVSKCIYIQILKCTETELLGAFMQTGGWALVHMWLVDGIGSKNWPLIQELLELLLCCPVDVDRLKLNTTPRLVKSLSTDSAHKSVRLLASKLVEQWLYIVKAPKQHLPIMMPQMPSGGMAAIADVKPLAIDQLNELAEAQQEGARNGIIIKNDPDDERNGVADQTHLANDEEIKQEDDGVETVRKTFRAFVEHNDQPYHKNSSLVLKITKKDGKSFVGHVTEVISPAKSKNRLLETSVDHGEVGEEDGEDGEEEEEEEVVVKIESSKSPVDPLLIEASEEQQAMKDSKKLDADVGSKEGANKERHNSSSSSKDKDRQHHHRDREKDRKGGSSSSGSRSSSSKSSSSSGSSSSKHRSSSSHKSSSSSSSSRDKDKDRHGSSSSNGGSHSNKHRSSSSSSSKSNGSSSKSGSSSSSEKHREKSSHSSGSSSNNKESKDSKSQQSSSSSSSKLAKMSRKSSKDEGGGHDSGSETSGNTATSGTKSSSSSSAVAAGGSSTSISSKKASISIEVRNPENRPKTVKTYNSQFRSHGLIEEAPPPPSRKGLKKPSSSASTSTTLSSNSSSSSATTATAVSNSSNSTTKPFLSSPSTFAGKDGVMPPEKKSKEDPLERPGSIKLIPPKRQHALIESDMFMDELSRAVRKDVKKRKRRTSGSENTATATGGTTSNKPEGAAGKTAGSDSPTSAAGETTTTATAAASTPAEANGTTPAVATSTPTSPKTTTVPPIVAPMSFYRDTLAEEDESAAAGKEGEKEGDQQEGESGGKNDKEAAGASGEPDEEEEGDEEEGTVRKPKRTRCELNEEESEEAEERKKLKTSSGEDPAETAAAGDKTELIEAVTSDVEKRIAQEAEEGAKEDSPPAKAKRPPGPGCGPDGPPGVLMITPRKGPKKQLRWRAGDEIAEVRYFELDVTERCNVTKSFTDMKQLERVDERQKFLLARKLDSEDMMTEKTPWRPLVLVDNVPAPPDGSRSVERNVQLQRERGCLQALYFSKPMIPDTPTEPDPVDTYQTADPIHIPLEDVTDNPDSVSDFTKVPWPDAKSTPPHDWGTAAAAAAFNSSFFPTELPPGAGFGPGGFPPPFPPGAANAASAGPAPWNLPPGAGVGGLQPGMFPLNQPPPGIPPVVATGGGGSPNILSLPPPGLFPPGAANFNAPPPDLSLLAGGGPDLMGTRRPPQQQGVGDRDFRNGPLLPQQQWVTGNGRPFGGGSGGGGGGNPQRVPNYGGSRGGGPGNWNRSSGSTGDRGRNGEEGRANFRGRWMQNGNNRGHNNNNRSGGGRKW